MHGIYQIYNPVVKRKLKYFKRRFTSNRLCQRKPWRVEEVYHLDSAGTNRRKYICRGVYSAERLPEDRGLRIRSRSMRTWFERRVNVLLFQLHQASRFLALYAAELLAPGVEYRIRDTFLVAYGDERPFFFLIFRAVSCSHRMICFRKPRPKPFRNVTMVVDQHLRQPIATNASSEIVRI